MNEEYLKLTAHFGERQRAARRPVFLADAMLDLFDNNDITTSVMLRGIASFGPRHVLRTDETLSQSEDPPVVVAAVDVASKVSRLVDDVLAMTGRGLVTLERAQLLDANGGTTGAGETVKLTVYVGRRERVGGMSAHRGVCELLHRHQFDSGTAFLGVDGTTYGRRCRASFFSRNVNVPLMIVAVGSSAQASAVIADLRTLAPRALLTIERIQLCKRDGALLDRPQRFPPSDSQGRAIWQKLTVLSSENSLHGGVPIHRALVRRLRDLDTARGATAVRGIWGFMGSRNPHGDKLFRLTRDVPVATTIVDTPERIAQTFEVVDRITAEHGLVTTEVVPAVVLVDGHDRDGGTGLARHHS